jgi:Fe-S cluster assembly protein SufD
MKNNLVTLFEKYSKNDFLKTLREKAFNTLLEKEPLFDPFFKNLLSNFLLEKNKKENIEAKKNHIIFFNNEYVSSNIDIEIIDLNKAAQKYPYLKDYLKNSIEKETNLYSLLNTSFLSGIFINITKDVDITIENIITQNNFLRPNRIFINVEKNKKVNLTFSKTEQDIENSLVNEQIDVLLNENSSLDILEDIFEKKAFYISNIRAKLLKKSNLKICNLSKNLKNLKTDYLIDLMDENAKIDLYILSLLKNSKINKNIKINHLNKNTHSNYICKTILNDDSIFDLKALVYMNEIAKFSSSKQLNKNIILDDKSTVNTKPNLEIFTDDVIATHGATTSNFDGDELFYLKTKGFDQYEATNILIYSFIRDLIDKIDNKKNIKTNYFHYV